MTRNDSARNKRDLLQRLESLSPEKRDLLLKRLRARQQAEDAVAGPSQATIPRRDREAAHFPVSFAQRRLWFLDQLEPGNPAYNIHMAFRLEGPLDTAALKRGLNEMVRRHETLRTTFAVEEGRPVQVIAPALTLDLPIHDLEGPAPAAQEAEVERLAGEIFVRSFDLSEGPLLRAALLRLGPTSHVLVFVMHHIISDGWSIGVFLRQWLALYDAYASGAAPDPLPLPVQYVDFAAWQRERLQGPILEEQLAFWKEALNGRLPVLELPTDHPRPTVQAYRGKKQMVKLPASLAKELRGVGQRREATLFMVLLAAFKALLHRYTGQTDLLVGTPVANRNRVEIENLIGFFVNTLVLRTDLEGNPSFIELLQRVRETALRVYENQEMPFEKLAEELQPERSLSHNPLFQVMFTFQKTSAPLPDLPDLTVTPLGELRSGTAKFDLTLSLVEDDDAIVGTVEYKTDLFEDATIGRFIGHYRTLLESVAADPTRPIGDLQLLTAAERRQLLVEWNETEGEIDDACLHELIAAQVERTPDAVAAVFGDQTLTFRQLNERANQLAHHLLALGVQPEQFVGLCVDRSLDMLVGLLGIHKAGAAYLPLDPDYPKERLAYMLADTEAPLLLTQAGLLGELPEHTAQVICLDADWSAIAREEKTNPAGEVTPDNLAYVIHTSGSTGKPKGVQITHRNVVNFLAAMQRKPGLSAEDVLVSVTTLSFDIAVLELFLPLLVGAKIVIVSRETAGDGRLLAQTLAEEKATVMQATPATWRLLIDSGWKGRKSLKALCGGEAMPRDLAEALLARCGELWNMYGPTETTVWSAVHRVESGSGPVSIGRPLLNTQIYLLDERMQPAPIGVAGELHIGGTGVARGYLNRPKLTEGRFVPDPFREEANARLYKTGDLARYSPNGEIEFIGRIDHQVKVRGFRIELGEIESVLSQHTAVRRCVAIVREDAPGDKRIVAYLIPAPDEAPETAELRHHLREKLPDYMIPAAFVSLDEYPLTPNGKIDRKALPAPEYRRAGSAEDFVAPRTAVEEKLAGMWRSLLKVDKVSIHDNFFEIGGHSLLAAQLISRIQTELETEIPLRRLFEAPTVAELAAIIDTIEEGDSSAVDREEDLASKLQLLESF